MTDEKTEVVRRNLTAAIALHKKHMDGSAPTTGPSGEKSQMAMMDMMQRALAALPVNNGAAVGMKMPMTRRNALMAP